MRTVTAMNNESKRPVGIGTGYLSIMMIFVVLCLTMLAALSYSTAQNEQKYSEKSGDYTKAYYAADLEAKRVLAAVDAVASEYDNYTDFMFFAELDEIDGVDYMPLPDGIEISWTTPINNRQSIRAAVKYSAGRYEITDWRTVYAEYETSAPLNVWNGE